MGLLGKGLGYLIAPSFGFVEDGFSLNNRSASAMVVDVDGLLKQMMR